MDSGDRLTDIGKALSSPARIQILNYLIKHPSIISDLSSALSLPISTTVMHINVLEKAGLISVVPLPGSRGSQKKCGVIVGNINIGIFKEPAERDSTLLFRQHMPLGNYFDYKVSAPCGIVSEFSHIAPEDDVDGFCIPERINAQHIWFTSGYLEYRFTNKLLQRMRLEDIGHIDFSFEVCSEAFGYNNDWPSDISVEINGIDAGTFLSPGDYGGRRGILNPEWWSDASTQYGDFRTLSITHYGCELNGELISQETLSSLNVSSGHYISFRLGVRPDADRVGGINLFGEKAGDHPQAIVMEIHKAYKNRRKAESAGEMETSVGLK